MDRWDENKRNVARMLFRSGCVKFGSFVLKSGVRSPIYLDLRVLVAFPPLLKNVALEYVSILNKLQYDHIAALPYAGMPIGTAVSLESQVSMIYPRKETKSYGTKAQIEGLYASGDTAVILDDIVTSGASVQEGLEKLRANLLKVNDVVVLIDRESGGRDKLVDDGLRVHSVFKFRDLLALWRSEKLISEQSYSQTMDFLNNGDKKNKI